jgi:hypothetical protein
MSARSHRSYGVTLTHIGHSGFVSLSTAIVRLYTAANCSASTRIRTWPAASGFGGALRLHASDVTFAINLRPVSPAPAPAVLVGPSSVRVMTRASMYESSPHARRHTRRVKERQRARASAARGRVERPVRSVEVRVARLDAVGAPRPRHHPRLAVPPLTRHPVGVACEGASRDTDGAMVPCCARWQQPSSQRPGWTPRRLGWTWLWACPDCTRT